MLSAALLTKTRCRSMLRICDPNWASAAQELTALKLPRGLCILLNSVRHGAVLMIFRTSIKLTGLPYLPPK